MVGPLLSESLDVRAIPIKKNRQLTMALSGNIDVNDFTPLLDSLSLLKGTSMSTRSETWSEI